MPHTNAYSADMPTPPASDPSERDRREVFRIAQVVASPDAAQRTTLDPTDWSDFRATAHRMLDAAIDKMATATQGRVWNEPTSALKQSFETALPRAGQGLQATQAHMASLLPYGVGNTHPRFFGWVHGSGTPGNLIADIATAAMNANLGGRDHGACPTSACVRQIGVLD